MKYQGLINDILSIPLRRLELLIAFTGSAVIRGLIVGFMTYLTAIFFVDFTYASIPIIISSAVLICFFFAFLGIIIGIWADEFDKTAFVQNFVLLPLIFLGGVFYAIDGLPEIAQKFSAFNPIVYMINLLRYGFTGVLEFPINLSFLVVGLSTAFLGVLSYLILRTGWRLQN